MHLMTQLRLGKEKSNQIVNYIKTYQRLGKSLHLLFSYRIEAYQKQAEDSVKTYQVNKENYGKVESKLRIHLGDSTN